MMNRFFCVFLSKSSTFDLYRSHYWSASSRFRSIKPEMAGAASPGLIMTGLTFPNVRCQCAIASNTGNSDSIWFYNIVDISIQKSWSPLNQEWVAVTFQLDMNK